VPTHPPACNVDAQHSLEVSALTRLQCKTAPLLWQAQSDKMSRLLL
jgi:hypothetical protein